MSREDAENQLDAPGERIDPPAEAAPEADPSPAPPPEAGWDGGDGPPEEGAEDPGPCPIEVVGYRAGRYFFTDPQGQFVVMSARQLHNVAGLSDLFLDRLPWATAKYPGTGQLKGVPAPNRMGPWLIARCVEKGMFDERQAVRGRGIWPEGARPEPGEALVAHLGEELLRIDPSGPKASAARCRVGARIGDFVYARQPGGETLAPDALTAEEGARLVRFLKRWNWRTPGLPSAELMAGHIVLQQIPALLRHRPIAWLGGDMQNGKSTLIRICHRLAGKRGNLKENPTDAYLREVAGLTDALAIFLDEAEAPADPSGRGGQKAVRMQDLVDTMRTAYDAEQGGWGRSGSNASEGKMEAIFMAGAINLPDLTAADMSRSLMLRLGPIADAPALPGESEDRDKRYAAFERERAEIETWGPRLLRRVLDRWRDFGPAVRHYAELLRAERHEMRAADTYGALLAAYEILVDDVPEEEMVRQERVGWIERAAVSLQGEGLSNAEACWGFLLSSHVGQWRDGVQEVIGELLVQAVKEDSNESPSRRELLRIGIAITDVRGNKAHGGLDLDARYIAVANTNAGLDDIFRKGGKAVWAGRGKANALRDLRVPDVAEDLPGVTRSPDKVYFAGDNQRATLINALVLEDVARGKEGDER